LPIPPASSARSQEASKMPMKASAKSESESKAQPSALGRGGSLRGDLSFGVEGAALGDFGGVEAAVFFSWREDDIERRKKGWGSFKVTVENKI
jgi:hypothetical protein